MRLGDMLHEGAIDLEMARTDKETVIRHLVERVALLHNLDPERTLEGVLSRERALSTGVGQGVAVPHATLTFLHQPVIGFGRSSEGVSFDSLDGGPVHLIFLLLSPEGDVPLHLKLLSRVSRLCQHGTLRDELLHAETSLAVLEAIRRVETSLQEL